MIASFWRSRFQLFDLQSMEHLINQIFGSLPYPILPTLT